MFLEMTSFPPCWAGKKMSSLLCEETNHFTHANLPYLFLPSLSIEKAVDQKETLTKV